MQHAFLTTCVRVLLAILVFDSIMVASATGQDSDAFESQDRDAGVTVSRRWNALETLATTAGSTPLSLSCDPNCMPSDEDRLVFRDYVARFLDSVPDSPLDRALAAHALMLIGDRVDPSFRYELLYEMGCRGDLYRDIFMLEIRRHIAAEYRMDATSVERHTRLDSEWDAKLYELSSVVARPEPPLLWLDLDLRLLMRAWVDSIEEVSPLKKSAADEHVDVFRTRYRAARINELSAFRHFAYPFGELSDIIFEFCMSQLVTVRDWPRRLDLHTEINRDHSALRDRVARLALEDRVRALENWRGYVDIQLGAIQDHLTRIDATIVELENRVDRIEAEVASLQQRLSRLEDWVYGKGPDLDQSTRALNELAPIIKHHDFTSGPFISPSDFVNRAEIIDGNGERVPNPSRQDGLWNGADLVRWLQDGNEGASASMKISPLAVQREILSDRTTIIEQNQKAAKKGHGVFGIVRQLGVEAGHQTYSFKYFWFLANNRTEIVNGYGSHEGDWLCVDLQVRFRPVSPDDGDLFDEPRVMYAIIHNHGKQKIVRQQELDQHDGRVVLYAERGVNELQPMIGGPSGCIGLEVFGHCAVGYTSPPHRGGGLPYDSLGRVKNLDGPEGDVDVELVMRWRGRWGASAVSAPLVYDADTPIGPRYNHKMWDRGFSNNPNDPTTAHE